MLPTIFDDSFERAVNAMLNGRTLGIVPAKKNFARMPVSSTYETENAVVSTFELPGVEKEDIKLNLEDDRIEVKVEKKQEKSIEKEGGACYSSNCQSFYGSTGLPAEVNSNEASATFKNGVLRIEIPKAKKQSKQIEIK